MLLAVIMIGEIHTFHVVAIKFGLQKLYYLLRLLLLLLLVVLLVL